MTHPEKKRKVERLCAEPAESEDYACSACGGDIRGLKCCSVEYCAIWIDGVLQERKP